MFGSNSGRNLTKAPSTLEPKKKQREVREEKKEDEDMS